MSKHTPGPWSAVGVDPYAKLKNRRWLIEPDIGLAKLKANANLIAAAPEAISALQDLADAIANLYHGTAPEIRQYTFGEAFCETIQCKIDNARAALKKAKGAS